MIATMTKSDGSAAASITAAVTSPSEGLSEKTFSVVSTPKRLEMAESAAGIATAISNPVRLNRVGPATSSVIFDKNVPLKMGDDLCPASSLSSIALSLLSWLPVNSKSDRRMRACNSLPIGTRINSVEVCFLISSATAWAAIASTFALKSIEAGDSTPSEEVELDPDVLLMSPRALIASVICLFLFV